MITIKLKKDHLRKDGPIYRINSIGLHSILYTLSNFMQEL